MTRCHTIITKSISLFYDMRPDYAHKQFKDKRTIYVLLMVALAEDCLAALSA